MGPAFFLAMAACLAFIHAALVRTELRLVLTSKKKKGQVSFQVFEVYEALDRFICFALSGLGMV